MGTPKRKGNSLSNGGPRILPARNLGPEDLSGVIFGCTDKTINECLTKQIFGLPGQHFVYVKHICPGLPLFLFNYSKRQLHGIFEAASPGQLNINPYGWTEDGSDRTSYPAQVQIRVQKICRPLLETQFAPIIKENYYTQSHFKFELDHVQVCKLTALFSTQVVESPAAMSMNGGRCHIIKCHQSEWRTNEINEINLSEAYDGSINHEESNGHLALTESYPTIPEQELEIAKYHNEDDTSEEVKMVQDEDNKGSLTLPSDLVSIIAELQELKAFKEESIQKEHRAQETQQMLLSEIQQLKDRCAKLEVYAHGIIETSIEQPLDPNGLIFLAGGYDGNSWLASLDSYSPREDVIKSLRSMSSVRSYASLAKLNGEIYTIGGGIDGTWYNIVESYNPVKNDWTSLPCLKEKKGGLGAATLHDKIFAIGGGNGIHCFSEVEMFDLDLGRWISARSMLQKRFDLAAVELNGAIYAVGGYDGKEYLSSAERFDPREHSWSRIKNMSSKRACHSLVVLNEKLYAIGGYDGSTMVPIVEVFDPRLGTWMLEAPMNYSRGYSATVALNDNIYAIGGTGANDDLLAKIERFQEGVGWEITNLKAVGIRCFTPAIVL